MDNPIEEKSELELAIRILEGQAIAYHLSKKVRKGLIEDGSFVELLVEGVAEKAREPLKELKKRTGIEDYYELLEYCADLYKDNKGDPHHHFN